MFQSACTVMLSDVASVGSASKWAALASAEEIELVGSVSLAPSVAQEAVRRGSSPDLTGGSSKDFFKWLPTYRGMTTNIAIAMDRMKWIIVSAYTMPNDKFWKRCSAEPKMWDFKPHLIVWHRKCKTPLALKIKEYFLQWNPRGQTINLHTSGERIEPQAIVHSKI